MTRFVQKSLVAALALGLAIGHAVAAEPAAKPDAPAVKLDKAKMYFPK